MAATGNSLTAMKLFVRASCSSHADLGKWGAMKSVVLYGSEIVFHRVEVVEQCRKSSQADMGELGTTIDIPNGKIQGRWFPNELTWIFTISDLNVCIFKISPAVFGLRPVA